MDVDRVALVAFITTSNSRAAANSSSARSPPACTLGSTSSSAADAADAGARETVEMRPRHGRAGWLAERSAEHEDAGARLVAIRLFLQPRAQ
jgi:phosphoenolpyruvate---glycerone phosphotransferase subunit DhaL